MSIVASKRKNLQDLLFPRGIPPLWCPSLTHFDDSRRIDLRRMQAHLEWMMPHVKGYLVPGSTGDGWDLDDAETETVVRFAVDMARKRGVSLLLGALRKKTTDVTDSIERFLDILRKLTGKPDSLAALIAAGVSGFTVCPPAGKDLDQATIGAALEIILDMGLPDGPLPAAPGHGKRGGAGDVRKACRKIPESHPLQGFERRRPHRPVRRRCARRVPRAGRRRGLCTVATAAGGTYDGFLLSTANSFPAGLLAVVDGIREGTRR